MTAWLSDRRARSCLLGALLALGACIPACRTGGTVPAGPLLEPLPRRAAAVPDAPARAARDTAAAALLGREDAARSERLRLEAMERARRERGEAPSGLVPVCLELEHATLRDHFAWRAATDALLERPDLDPARRRLLEQELRDDPLRLADRRLADARRSRFARTFNTLAEPLGRSLTSTALAPYRLARALVRLAAQQAQREPISVPERQALAHWKQYVETHPGTPEAAALLERIEALQRRWYAMKRERHLASARRALDAGQNTRALVLAERVLRYAPEDDDASALLEQARARRGARLDREARSLAAPEAPPLDAGQPAARDLGVALLHPDGDRSGAAARLLQEAPAGPLADAARFAAANATPRESATWSELARLAEQDPTRTPMARHAGALVRSPTQHPWAAFQRARSRERRQRAAWVLAGPFADPTRHASLPWPLARALDVFSLVPMVAGLPTRILRAPFLPEHQQAAAVHARHYLARHPRGEHADEARRWLVDWELDRGNAIGAHRLAADGDPDPDRIAGLREDAAAQAVSVASRQTRPDVRFALLGRVTQEYPGTEGARRAGRQLREEIEQATSQRIRISRGFLLENRELAGPTGLALRAELLDDDPANGELHPDGVFLIGGRTLEFALLDETGDPEAPPHVTRRRVSDERLARIVGLLEETARRNALVDADAPFEPDADRDRYFERARLGVADRPDPRPTARSSYAFRGMRERYGMVRSRESILPVELVIQGSFPDLGLGAFPRIRTPKPTPDAILYR